MSDSDDDAPERVAKNCLKQLLDITTNLMAKAVDDTREDAKAMIEQGTGRFSS